MKTLSELARETMLRERGEPWFLSAWKGVLMMHYAVKPEYLQKFVPFELDTINGMAYVTLVGFTLERLRPRLGLEWAFKPIATHDFLNVRTYVKHKGESGIYFLAEWLPNRLSVCMGRPIFGLPYRLGKTDYAHENREELSGSVNDGAEVKWHGKGTGELAPAAPGSLTEWLMERYTAFTSWLGIKRRFRVWHTPWQQCEVDVRVTNTDLLGKTGDWIHHAHYAGAQWSPGFDEVWMGAPRFV
jgi:uncharacterized protein